jgi:hypothetical protein
LIALSFRNVVRHFIPVLPMCFSSCKGIALNPELLFALKWCWRTVFSSSVVMQFAWVSVSGVKVSLGMVSSKKMLSLNFLKAGSDSSVLLSSLRFSMFQNFFGCYFSISGSVNCSCARPSLQACAYRFRACIVCACSLPFFLLAVLYRVRASLHRALNHGALCLSHLLGLCDVRLVIFVRTPASIASYIKNASTCVERSSFSSVYFCMMASHEASNFGVEVCYFHFTALLPYSLRHSPSTQRKDDVVCVVVVGSSRVCVMDYGVTSCCFASRFPAVYSGTVTVSMS